ncbi:tetratricopeptide repeat protein [Streptomyces sp. NPDC046261]|uniref:tetratricopeptide repeat protein n=1 Tax=Streptomyces sp. NPDC046261 TaxID=3157200 RepID=UPI0033E38FBD
MLLSLIVIAVSAFFWIRRKRRATPSAAQLAAAGWLPPERQNTERSLPDPEAEAVEAALARGDWQPAARALAATGTDWERRSALVGIIAAEAVKDDTWLRAWETAHPDDPGAAVVKADAKVSLAWEVRGGSWAKDTTAEQFAGFHRLLEEAREDFGRAVSLAAPDDPTPYALQIPLYMGLGAPHEAMRELWAEVTTRAPYHFEAHWYALKYWYPRWRGSEELARDFAYGAALTAPPGNLLTMFPLVNWYDHLDDDAPEVAFRSVDLTAMVDAALMDVAACRPDHPRLAEVRHLLAYVLTKQERYAEAVEQFRRVDGHVGAMPWTHYPTKQAEAFCLYRDAAIVGSGALRGRR